MSCPPRSRPRSWPNKPPSRSSPRASRSDVTWPTQRWRFSGKVPISMPDIVFSAPAGSRSRAPPSSTRWWPWTRRSTSFDVGGCVRWSTAPPPTRWHTRGRGWCGPPPLSGRAAGSGPSHPGHRRMADRVAGGNDRIGGRAAAGGQGTCRSRLGCRCRLLERHCDGDAHLHPRLRQPTRRRPWSGPATHGCSRRRRGRSNRSSARDVDAGGHGGSCPGCVCDVARWRGPHCRHAGVLLGIDGSRCCDRNRDCTRRPHWMAVVRRAWEPIETQICGIAWAPLPAAGHYAGLLDRRMSNDSAARRAFALATDAHERFGAPGFEDYAQVVRAIDGPPYA